MSQAQKGESYEQLWKQVDKLEMEQLTQSAYKVVQGIQAKSQKENNSPQTVKALLYASKYALVLEEEAQLKIIQDFKEEIDKATSPTKNILHSYLANLYWQYVQQNRYRIYNRTETTSKVNPEDFRTWDVTTLFSEITYHFEKSLKESKILQNASLKDFDAIIHKQENSEKYRPTLYDLLAYNALDFYKTSENSINQPSYKFEITNENLLCEAYDFAQRPISSKDSTSLQLKALQTFQGLVQFHFQDPEPSALAHVDIERLKFIFQNAVFEKKEERYVEVLKNTAESLQHHEVSALYQYEIAQQLHNQGNAYKPENNPDAQWKQKEAIEICQQVLAKFPDSYGAEKCKALQSQVKAESLQLTTEKFLPTNKTARLLVKYKNIKGLKLSAHKISEKELEALQKIHPQEKRLSFIQNLKTETSWSATLKNQGDYQQHGIEIELPPLVNGRYIILATTLGESNTFGFSEIQVTDIAVVETKKNQETSYQFINRINGKPLVGAKVNFSYLKNYNQPKMQKTATTDAMGRVTVSPTKEYWSNVKIEVEYGDEIAVFGEYYINEAYEQNEISEDYRCFLFTDRSIYRPGQPLHYKGIAISTKDEKSVVLTNTMVNVNLIDVNGQTLGTQKAKTNEFGSFSGEFIIPTSVLTGSFSLEADGENLNLDGYTTFSVEEYKRPKFQTNFNPVKETYKVNDSVTVTGKAQSYAGSNITQAKVTYKVKRTVQFPRWYYWSRPIFRGSEQEITHGETLTDANGNYHITFKALPDASVPKSSLPTFEYEITADVTDINGETQSTSQTVKVGYHSLNAQIQVAENLQKDPKTTNLTISTTNLNGEFVPVKGIIKIYKLSAPNYVLRQRPWPAPDYQNWNKEDFKELFPHDAYKDEQDFRNWPMGKVVKELNFDTEKTTKIQLEGIQKWTSGKYVLQLETKDKFGNEVNDKAFTTLHSEKDKVVADNQLFDISTDQENYEIGDTAEITLSSNADDLSVSVFVEKDGKKVDERIITLNGNSKTFKVKIDEADLGGFAINYTYAAYNSFESGSLLISVPYPKTDLEIETLTFRDKIAPGSEESWSFKIKGPNGDQISSELLASMYDASLDAFRPHSWSFNPLYRPIYYSQSYANAHTSFGNSSFRTYLDNDLYHYKSQGFDGLNFFGLYFSGGYNMRMRGMVSKSAPVAMAAMDAEADMAGQALEEVVQVGQSPKKEKSSVENASEPSSEEKEGLSVVSVRTNLQETAFFYPHLQTDKEGNVSFSFTSPEALTRWKLQLLAHTKNLNSTVTSMETLTQKELMVIPNAPRFLREGDEIQISTKIANLTNQSLSGSVYIELTDAVNGKDLTPQLLAETTERNFKVDSSGNTQASWRLQIPEGLQAVQYKIVAKAGDYSDGEQNLLPVLTNRMLVTETLPMWVKGNETKKFELTKLKENSSSSLEHHKLTLEVTSNPAWYAVQALPYLMEYPYECSEQIFSRFYANTLASHIINSNPRMKNVFEQWKGTGALKSNLEKNEELKSLLIQETPWLRDAQSESEQKKRIALLFELNNLKAQQTTTLAKLVQNQKASGAWAWFQNGPDNRTITQHIVTGLGHLKKLQVAFAFEQSNLESSIQRALQYLDDEFVEEYEQMKKHSTDLDKNHLSQSQIHYLYMRSFFNDYKTSVKLEKTMDYYWSQAKKYWTKQSLYSKGLLALSLSRHGYNKTAQLILRSLKENSVFNEELGRYWKNNTASWYWYQAPIETQSLLIEAFEEITQDTQTVDELKIWLLKNKQTNQWATTKATTEAIYSLLLSGSDWVSVTDAVEVTVGNKMIDPSQLENVRTEAGTGYFKTSWESSEIKPEMAQVEMTKKGDGISWGALYWQYFEDLDKITSAETPLKLKKQLFLKTNTDTGEKLVEITNSTNLKVGDLVRVRIELRSDREMEFIHMKDMRAAGFEPVNVLSSYKWQDGLGYYESTKDASTNFFFDRLPKGTFVFEYDLRVNNAGEFSNGITTIQNMYAPEFSSQSEGTRVKVNG